MTEPQPKSGTTKQKSPAKQAAEALAVGSTNFSQESERAVCAAMLRTLDDLGDKSIHAKLAALLAPEDFFLEQHQAIWSIATAMQTAGLPSDPVAISDAAARQDLFIGGAPYLSNLIDDPLARSSTPESIYQASKRIKELSMLRRLQATLRQALALSESGNEFSSVASFVEDDLVNLRSASASSRTGPRHLHTFIDTVVARMQAALDGAPVAEGALTGFPELDRLTGGLLPETFTVIAGRPSMGKTALAMNIEQGITASKRPTLLFSLEMAGITLAQRHIASHARIPLGALKAASLSNQEWFAFTESVSVLQQIPCYIDDSPGLGISEIRARSRAFINEHPTGVILLDYLQLVAQGKYQLDQTSHIREVSKGLKAMARELRCPVVALAQLSRDLEKRTNKRPMMADLRESGQIEQDSEVILFLYRDEVYNPDTPEKGITEVIIGKNRDGATGTVKMHFEGRVMRFTELGGVMQHD